MANRLRTELERIADEFVSTVLSALRSASLDEVIKYAPQPSGRLPARLEEANGTSSNRPMSGRAPRGEIQRQKDAVMTIAGAPPSGFRKADIVEKTGLNVNVSRALSLLVTEGKLARKGDRNQARY